MIKKTICIFCFLIILLSCPISFGEGANKYKDIIDEITNARVESLYNIDLNAPFTKEKSGIREEIDIETGTLTIECEFFSLEARGEGKFDFSLKYTPIYASVLDESIDEDGENAPLEKESLNRSMLCFGNGWRMDLPYIENPGSRNKTYTYIHLPSGATYRANSSTETGLDDYELDDVIFTEIETYIAGVECEFVLMYKDGTKYYFNSKGLPVIKLDKYLNTIKYSWVEDKYFYLLESISDNADRIINFEYLDNIVYIKYKDSKYTIIRTLIDKATNTWQVDSVIDPVGRKTDFNYYTDSVNFTYKLHYMASNDNEYYLLNYVSYPTGLKCYYEYIKSRKWLYAEWNGYIDYFKIAKRYDVTKDGVSNLITYNYDKEPDGYPDYKTKALPDDYVYYVTETIGSSVQNYYKFNYKHNPIQKKYINNGILLKDEYSYYDVNYRLPIKTLTRIYNTKGNCRQEIIEKTYDSFGFILSYDKYEKSPQNRKIKFKYGGDYNLCIYESYMQDDKTKIEIIRTLTNFGKNIGDERILKNGVEVKRTEFEYNLFGDLIKEIQISNSKNPTITNYVYDAENAYLYPTKII